MSVNAVEVIMLTQAAALARWKADGALLAHLGGPNLFEDRVPEGEVPARYVLIGEPTASPPTGAMGHRGSNVTLSLSSWTRGEPDSAAAVETVRLMDAALEAPLVLAGFGSAHLENEFTAVVPADDPALHHAPARYRIHTFAN